MIGGSTAERELAELRAWPNPAPAITREERLTRLAKAQSLMTTDALIIGAGASLRYFAGVGWNATERLVAMVLPKSGVLSLRVHSPPSIPEKTGTGLMAGGIVLTSIAAPIFISGVAVLAVCPSCTYIHLPLLIIGAGMLGGGIPMTVIGALLCWIAF